MINFVGRDEELKVAREILDVNSEEKFLIITGGPCYGKSSLAVKIGREMYEEAYSYVIWVNMRDITSNDTSPSIEDLALIILQRFDLDTSQLKDDIELNLKKKFAMITEKDKSALLIFDNADSLIQPGIDKSCQSTTIEKLWQLIRNTSRKSIRAVFTTRVCKTLPDKGYEKITLGHFSSSDSLKFFSEELRDVLHPKKDALIKELVDITRGLPYALRLICAEVIDMENDEMIEDYVKDLKENTINALDDDDYLKNTFDMSYKRLKDDERKVFTSLAVFPSGFSYSYLSKYLRNVKSINVKPLTMKSLTKHSLVDFDSGRYLIHPFLRDFLLSTYWHRDSRRDYYVAYYKTYINQLFSLASESLDKDKFSDCLEEFRNEQQNFVHVMAEIGKGLTNSPPYLIDVVKELLNRPTPDYITVLLFYCHEVYSVVTMDFFKGCELFMEGQMKKNIWCCRFDANMAIFEKEINDDYKDTEADEYGKALVDKRKLYLSATRNEDEFNDGMSRLDAYKEWAEKIDDHKMKTYFTVKILKTRVRLSKKVYKILSIDKNLLIGDLRKALELCEKTFGVHGLTIDSHTQLGKLFWFLNDEDNAMASFDRAIHLAETLRFTGNKRYICCLMDKGRFLIDSKESCSILEGKRLLGNALDLLKDASDAIMWLLSMQSLVKVDRKKSKIIIDNFLKEERLFHPSFDAMHTTVIVLLDYPDEEVNEENFIRSEDSLVEKLCEVTAHLENISNQSTHSDESLFKDALIKIYLWTTWIGTKCMHVLSESKTKEFANKGLMMIGRYKCITGEKRDELQFIKNCDQTRYTLMQQKCHIDQMAKRIPSIKHRLEDDLMKLLKECEQYPDVWAWAIRGLSRDNKEWLRYVTSYLLTQSEPNRNLLKLVLHKFFYEIGVCKRESDGQVIIEKSRSAIADMEKAIKHVEGLQTNHVINRSTNYHLLEDNLKSWYTHLALDTENFLAKADRRRYASQALQRLGDRERIVKDDQKRRLKDLVSSK